MFAVVTLRLPTTSVLLTPSAEADAFPTDELLADILPVVNVPDTVRFSALTLPAEALPVVLPLPAVVLPPSKLLETMPVLSRLVMFELPDTVREEPDPVPTVPLPRSPVADVKLETFPEETVRFEISPLDALRLLNPLEPLTDKLPKPAPLASILVKLPLTAFTVPYDSVEPLRLVIVPEV
jgi:hypothetical protein